MAKGSHEIVEEEMAYESVEEIGTVLTKEVQEVHNVITASGDEENQYGECFE